MFIDILDITQLVEGILDLIKTQNKADKCFLVYMLITQ